MKIHINHKLMGKKVAMLTFLEKLTLKDGYHNIFQKCYNKNLFF